MSHDLERAFGDLADAAARAAERGILAGPAVEPTLHRIVTKVRRRRAARTAGAGALALVVLAGSAGVVDGLERRSPGPPAGTPSASATALCGASTAQVEALDDGAAPGLTLENRTAPVVSTAEPFHFVAAGVNGGEPLVVDGWWEHTVLLARDGSVVASSLLGIPLETTTVGTGETFLWDGPAVVYDCATLDGVTRAPAGDYELWLVAKVAPAGAGAEPADVVGGPWPITLTDDQPSPGPTYESSPGPAFEPSATGTSSPPTIADATRCGASDDGLSALDWPITEPMVVGITAPPVEPVAVGEVPNLTITVDNVGAEKVDLGTANPRVVLTRDHVIVGGVAFGTGSRGPALAGESTEYSLTEPLVACVPGGDALDAGGPALTPGDYGAWVVLTVRPLGATEDRLALGGPFAVTLTGAGS